jgi:oligopeptidase B
MNLGYDPTWIPLLERGFVLAFAHTRGGGDLGRAWYHAGRLENKTKAIEDFIACAEALKTGPFAGGALTAKAFSAGGIVVGAAVNQEPELFNNVVLTNAFCDLRATLSNPDLFLTKHEWDEYGNPLVDTNIEKVIRSYCPTSNIVPGARYPRFILIGTVDDENVPYYNAVIFASKLRSSGVDKDRVQLHVEDGGGHNLGGGHRIPVAALEVSFIVENS